MTLHDLMAMRDDVQTIKDEAQFMVKNQKPDPLYVIRLLKFISSYLPPVIRFLDDLLYTIYDNVELRLSEEKVDKST